jgi:pyruvate/2-oxoglutarate dehydrogenase complex dihydrolipoamide dehydrogenase (E3) component
MSERADVVVIGMGPGGEEVAGKLAEAGLDVVGIERRLLGGECPYWGCVPSKMMIRAANALAEGRRIPALAGTSTVTPSWETVARRIRDEATDDWDDRVAVERFTKKGGRFVRGTGRLAGAGAVEVDGTRIEAERGIVVATGTTAAIPPVPGLRYPPCWTNREAIEVEVLPASLIVLGGGAIGAELSQVFARFGVSVTIVEAVDRLVPPEEPEASALLTRVFEREGISVRTSASVSSVSHEAGGVSVTLEDGTSLRADQLLVATGRRADLAGLGVDTVGLDPGQKWLKVDPFLRAGPGLWAVGDVTGEGAFTHVAMYQAGIAIDDILGRDPAPARYHALPRVTFTDPEIGSVGLTAAAAADQGRRVRIGAAELPNSARGWIHKAGNEGLIKLVEDADRGVLVGATSAGPAGGEVLSMLTLAVHAQVPTSELRRMIYAYPTFHRAVEDALRNLDG